MGWECSHCHAPLMGPDETCGGKFTDTDHPPSAPAMLSRSNLPATAEAGQEGALARADALAELILKPPDYRAGPFATVEHHRVYARAYRAARNPTTKDTGGDAGA